MKNLNPSLAPKPSLKEIQSWFLKSLHQSLLVETPDEGTPWAWINETKSFKKKERLSVYHEGFFWRFYEALSTDFPVTFSLMERKPFQQLIRRFLNQHMPTSFSLSEIGEALPKFVEKDPLFKDSGIPSDLVRMEWYMTKAYFSSSCATLTPEILAQLTSRDPHQIFPQIDPSVFLIDSNWPLPQIYSQEKLLPQQPTKLVIYRKNSIAHYMSLSPLEFQVLRLLKDSLSLGHIFETIDQGEDEKSSSFQNKDSESLTREISQGFQTWVQETIISDIKFTSS